MFLRFTVVGDDTVSHFWLEPYNCDAIDELMSKAILFLWAFFCFNKKEIVMKILSIFFLMKHCFTCSLIKAFFYKQTYSYRLNLQASVYSFVVHSTRWNKHSCCVYWSAVVQVQQKLRVWVTFISLILTIIVHYLLCHLFVDSLCFWVYNALFSLHRWIKAH